MAGGLPIVIFTGDFLQFGPIHLLTSNKLRRRANDRKVQRHAALVATDGQEALGKIVILEE
jgi:hypothetical protein